MTIVGYARVSSREQLEDSQALEQQCDRLTRAGAEKLYIDVESGSKDNRPQFKAMMDAVSKGQVKKIIITRLDRLTRSLPTLRKTIDEMEKGNCHLCALDDSIETDTAAGRFQINMLGALAEMEVDRLSERIKHGWKYVRGKGKAIRSPFGYRVEDGKHVFDTEEFVGLIETKEVLSKHDLAKELIRVFFEMKSIRSTVHVMNSTYGVLSFNQVKGYDRGLHFTASGLSSWLRNPVLRGHTYYPVTGEIHYNTHEGILSEEEYKQIDKTLQFNDKFKRTRKSPVVDCVGLVYCSRCRFRAMIQHSISRTKKKYFYFQCRGHFQKTCDNKKMVRVENVREAIACL